MVTVFHFSCLEKVFNSDFSSYGLKISQPCDAENRFAQNYGNKSFSSPKKTFLTTISKEKIYFSTFVAFLI